MSCDNCKKLEDDFATLVLENEELKRQRRRAAELLRQPHPMMTVDDSWAERRDQWLKDADAKP